MADKKSVLRFDTLRKRVAGTIDINGTAHDVLQMDFATHHDLAASEGTPDGIDAVRQTVRKVAPSIDEVTLGALTLDDAQQILALSGGGIAAVERLFPNAIGPESQTSPA